MEYVLGLYIIHDRHCLFTSDTVLPKLLTTFLARLGNFTQDEAILVEPSCEAPNKVP